MSLDLDLSITGRKPLFLVGELGRELTEADLALLQVERGIKPIEIKKLTDSHHALARCLARGMKPVDASVITGYTLTRISILQGFPLFRTLVDHYRRTEDRIEADILARMSSLSLEALEELRERLQDTPDEFSPAMLLEIAKVLADRTGYGPASRTTNVNVNVDLAGRLERARERVKTIDMRTIDADPGPGTRKESVDTEDNVF